MEKNDEFRVVKIGFLKKIWLSITKFERYPEMATEGVFRALSYLTKLILIFCVIISIGMMYSFKNAMKKSIEYINGNFSEVNYKDETLEIKPNKEKNKIIETDIGTLIIDTNTKEENKIREYEKSIKDNKLGIIWLNNKVILYANGMEEAYYYSEILDIQNIKEFNKTDLINYLSNNKMLYVSYFAIVMTMTFIAYFLSTIIDILVLSCFGVLTAYMARIRIRYRAIFNMSVYALTISIILRMLYILISMYTDFTIKYFDFMYNAIGYICLMASIFMIKSDVIKQQMELIRIRERMKEEEQIRAEQDKDEKSNDEENDKEDTKTEEKDETEPSAKDNGTENQGSHA